MSSPPRIAISLGASFMGYATHAGFMARLHALGVRPVALAGASAGAITSGLYAAGLEQEAIRQTVLSPRLYLAFASRTKWIWHQFVNVFKHRHPGFLDPKGAIAHFESLVGTRSIESLTDPKLMITLSDLSKNETLFASRGPLATAMAASSCVPMLFSPLEFDGRMCTDGGVAHETPVDPWFKDESIDHIVMHRITQPQGKPPLMLPGRLLDTIAASHESMTRQILADRIELARLHGKKLTLITTTHPRPSPLFPGRLKNCYQLGEDTAQKLFDTELSQLL
ncbi:patatin-like phospholipase family protein [Prosthecobacter sp.]|uniref:patatin-like phospholipase family protein n=1 Tax=Prosthecobacter sp. TaxID=1965333 RepID=UPI002AB8AAF3|nr:patatin-like phospholipase family protein [Prosthecobacter sp.]MDZ4402822.1 patatin-like phospholipase family protein [Prosthecobacter sp.]